MPETHVPDSSFSPFRWWGLCAKSLNPLHLQVPTEFAAVSSHVHHTEEHTVQALPSFLFQSPTADAAPARTAPRSSGVFPNISALGTTQGMTRSQVGACKHQEKRKVPFWVDFKLLPRGLQTDIFKLFSIRNQLTCAEGFNKRSCIGDWERPRGSFMLHQKLLVEKGHPSQSRRSQPQHCPQKLPPWIPAARTPWTSHLGALLRLWLVSQKPAWSLQSYKMVIQLPLLQRRARRVCSSSKLKHLALETTSDTFSPRGYQHCVPLSPSSWQGRRQQRGAHEPGRGMGALVGGGMSPAAWQELNGSSRTWCHLLPLQSPSAQPQSQGVQRRPYFQLNFSFIQRDRRLPYQIVSKSEF